MITFNKEGKVWVAEFEITDACNIHLDFNTATPIRIFQKTTGTNYDLVDYKDSYIGKGVDVDVEALVYPKQIKIVAGAEPTFGEVTYNS